MDGMIGKSLGKYQIVEPLGEGGMATVYKAFDPSLERYVAIKIIRAMNQIDSDFLIRFKREARALAKLDHPYILKVLDYGEENGVPYLVMPYVSHGTLKQYINKRIGYEKALEIILPIAEALRYAHNRKIIHRDIKPANILFGESEEPILSDFGIAKMLDAGEQTQLTGTGLGIGTPAYMAPEQWNGIADERTDIYALGIVLYELITGRCPFQADTPAAILIKQVQDPLPRPSTFVSDLPEYVEALLFKALAKDPTLRFQSMQEFIQGMNSVLRGKPVDYALPTQAHSDSGATKIASKPVLEPYSINPDEESPKKQRWLPWAIGGGLVLIVGCVLLILILSLSNFDLLNRKEPTSVVDNESKPITTQLSESITPANTESPSSTQIPKITATEAIIVTNTPNSVDSIEGLADDYPVFTPNNGDVTKTTVENAIMFTYSTSSDRESVNSFIEEEMARLNWILVSTSEMASQETTMHAFQKDNRNVVITVASYQENQTFIQLILSDDGG